MTPFALAIRLLPLVACLAYPAAPREETATIQPDSRITVVSRGSSDTTLLRENEQISVDFPENEIEEILRAVAGHFGFTIATNQPIPGRTSLSQRNVTWINIFSDVLTPRGFDFYPDGYTIKVIRPGDPPAPLAQRQYRCIFGTAADFTELAKAECAKDGKGQATSYGQIVAVSADWRTALDLDLFFGIWDRPRRIYPREVHLPFELPLNIRPPAASVQVPAPPRAGSVQPTASCYSTEIGFTWIEAGLAKAYLQTLLTEPGESIELGISPNSLRITTRIAPSEHWSIDELCHYLDDRKWYLTAVEQNRAEELAKRIIGPPRHQPPQARLAESTVSGTQQSYHKQLDVISVDFPDEDCATILKNAAAHFGRKVELPDDFHGRTSVRLRNITCWQIFREVLSPLGYDFYPDGTSIVVVPAGAPITRVYREYTCVYRPAEEFAELIRRQTAGVHGNCETVGRTVKARLDWDWAERLDSHFKIWDRPPHTFPEIYWPDQLPPGILVPSLDCAPERTRQNDLNDQPSTTEIFLLEWASAQAVAARLRSILERPQDSLQIDDTDNTLIVTTDPQRQEIVGRICKYFDDRKWYLSPEEREPSTAPTPNTKK